mgnify:FL=1
MSTKRILDTSILPKNWRKLNKETKLTFYYLWFNCDPSGVWEIDFELFAFENSFELDLNYIKDLNVTNFKDKFLLLNDFIIVNYTALKHDYNPHKPCFRAIEKNKLILNPSLNQAYFKLVDVDEEEDVIEDEEEDKAQNKIKKEKKIISIKQNIYDGNFSESFREEWERWKSYKKEQHNFKFKSFDTEKTSINELFKLSNGIESIAVKIINQSISNGWKGFFKLKDKEQHKNIKSANIGDNTSFGSF